MGPDTKHDAGVLAIDDPYGIMDGLCAISQHTRLTWRFAGALTGDNWSESVRRCQSLQFPMAWLTSAVILPGVLGLRRSAN